MSDEKGKWISTAVNNVLGTVKNIADPMEKLERASDIGMKWADKFTEDPDEKREFATKIIEGVHATNQADAKSGSWWQSGWRPYIGYVCGTGLLVFFPIKLSVITYIWARYCILNDQLIPFPDDADGLMNLTISMLGLALYRTAEKRIGKAK